MWPCGPWGLKGLLLSGAPDHNVPGRAARESTQAGRCTATAFLLCCGVDYAPDYAKEGLIPENMLDLVATLQESIVSGAAGIEQAVQLRTTFCIGAWLAMGRRVIQLPLRMFH